ncbi:SDR family NAD(P)-dependent oxidoreductase [Stagnihabitans tardus]|uniref:SDR family NAD(P)-dependent oxidoreductase n=1 Tax=Stagnihabitans tardus TaxID=2699202 RepID=A0AAE5BRD5_9RHOB|nr:SDR family NAD(P)-dependent oxidoreductase [Stagnihabitans tardus]NBZ86435.1 SDR family NAD(P)-dependent oxidoreductase [Stagnihabitans tardus]
MTHPALRSGHTAIVTGAASGIGRAAALAFARLGMEVALIDLPGPMLGEAREAVAALGVKALALPADVGDRAALQAAASRIATELAPVSLVMNNAGRGESSSCLGDPGAFERTFAANLWGVIHGTQVFGALVSRGAIINTGSKQGITTPPGNPAYNVSKAAVKAFTEALAHELRTTRPEVSAHLLIPGWVHTGMTAASGAPKPAGAWTPEQTVDFLLQSLDRGDFYILCPDNDTPRSLDEQRMAWAMGDIIQNRPALSRWHPDWAESFKASLKS